jgi:hypothetical protein
MIMYGVSKETIVASMQAMVIAHTKDKAIREFNERMNIKNDKYNLNKEMISNGWKVFKFNMEVID